MGHRMSKTSKMNFNNKKGYQYFMESGGKKKKYSSLIEKWAIANFSNIKYDYYCSPSSVDIVEKALNMERMYQLNCSDRPKDLSAEAVNQRIHNHIQRLRKEYYG